jgi:hypothetical protein
VQLHFLTCSRSNAKRYIVNILQIPAARNVIVGNVENKQKHGYESSQKQNQLEQSIAKKRENESQNDKCSEDYAVGGGVAVF